MSAKLDQLTEIAKVATHARLEELNKSGYTVSDAIKDRLSLEIDFDGEYRIFLLVVAGENPQDARVLTSVKGNIDTMELAEVFVSLELMEKADL